MACSKEQQTFNPDTLEIAALKAATDFDLEAICLRGCSPLLAFDDAHVEEYFRKKPEKRGIFSKQIKQLTSDNPRTAILTSHKASKILLDIQPCLLSCKKAIHQYLQYFFQRGYCERNGSNQLMMIGPLYEDEAIGYAHRTNRLFKKLKELVHVFNTSAGRQPNDRINHPPVFQRMGEDYLIEELNKFSYLPTLDDDAIVPFISKPCGPVVYLSLVQNFLAFVQIVSKFDDEVYPNDFLYEPRALFFFSRSNRSIVVHRQFSTSIFVPKLALHEVIFS